MLLFSALVLPAVSVSALRLRLRTDSFLGDFDASVKKYQAQLTDDFQKANFHANAQVCYLLHKDSLAFGSEFVENIETKLDNILRKITIASKGMKAETQVAKYQQISQANEAAIKPQSVLTLAHVDALMTTLTTSWALHSSDLTTLQTALESSQKIAEEMNSKVLLPAIQKQFDARKHVLIIYEGTEPFKCNPKPNPPESSVTRAATESQKVEVLHDASEQSTQTMSRLLDYLHITVSRRSAQAAKHELSTLKSSIEDLKSKVLQVENDIYQKEAQYLNPRPEKQANMFDVFYQEHTPSESPVN